MNNKFKTILSILTIGLFVIFAAASLGPDGSTNTTVKISNCESKPAVQGQLKVSVTVSDLHGNPIAANAVLYAVHQKVNADTTCTFSVLSTDSQSFTIPFNGIYHFDGATFIHDNSEDLFRVQLKINANAIHAGYDEVQVVKYSQSNVFFSAMVLAYNDL